MTKMAGKQMPGTVGAPLGKLTTNVGFIKTKTGSFLPYIPNLIFLSAMKSK
jgi:hypothetical protein